MSGNREVFDAKGQGSLLGQGTEIKLPSTDKDSSNFSL